MKRVAILLIVLAVIFSATAFARDRYDMDGVKGITSAFIHTAKGDVKLDLNRSVFNVYS